MKDKQGREYLKLAEAKEGATIELDDGFTCVEAGPSTLFKDERGVFRFGCAEGSHRIDSQANDGIHCIGIYPVVPS